MKKLLLLFIMAGLAGCATYQSTTAKPLNSNQGKLHAVDIWIQSGENPIGAYTITLEYDARIINIQNITGGGDRHSFPGNPMTNLATFTTGRTIIAGFYPGKNLPAGRVKIATVIFQPVKPGTSPVKTTLQNLYNYSSQPIPQGKVITSADSITVK